MNTVNRCYCLVVAAVTLLLFWTASIGEAAEITFAVNPSSSLSLSAVFAGLTLEEQAPGSLTTTYSGTMTVDVDDLGTPTSIDFLSSMLVAANSGSWLPAVGGGPSPGDPGSAAPANYGAFKATSPLLVGNLYAAIRGMQFDTTTPGGPLAVTGGTTFPSTQTFTITSGTSDINAAGGLADLDGDASTSSLVGDNGVNAASDSTYSRVGSIVSLTIPIDLDLPLSGAAGSGTAFIDGMLTAVADISTGDFDQDGDQDGRDFLIWQRGFGTLIGANLGDGDGTFDGAVLGDDLALWEGGFGTLLVASSGLSTSIGAVPEPASLGMSIVLGVIPLRTLRRRL